MLGHLVRQYLEGSGQSVAVSERRYTAEPGDLLVDDVVASRPDVVLNCAGVTPQRDAPGASLFAVNSVLPQHVAAALEPGQVLIHPSTDGVFAGRTGAYRVDDQPDSLDPYGISKRLGELVVAKTRATVVVLRTSLVGPEEGTARGLLAWFLAQKQAVNGWVDHRWNGITTLAWAELALGIAQGSVLGPGLHHPTTAAPVTKYELLDRFADAFDHRIEVRPVESGAPIDRTLVPSHPMPPLEEQLSALRSWVGRQAA